MHANHFADQLRIIAALEPTAATERTLDAFRSVPREAFAGEGPWRLRSAFGGFSLPVFSTPDADPKWLYHATLIVLDEAKGINIGDPSLWVRLLAQTDVTPGTRILQVGAGVGYYSAILSALAGPKGRVTAYEVEPTLFKRASKNLEGYANVDLRQGNAATDLIGQDSFDLVVAFAGVTHIPQVWAERLSENARLLLPMTGDTGWGAMIIATPSKSGFDARTLGPCGFYPCTGARDERLAKQVNALFLDRSRLTNWRFLIRTDGAEVNLEAASH